MHVHEFQELRKARLYKQRSARSARCDGALVPASCWLTAPHTPAHAHALSMSRTRYPRPAADFGMLSGFGLKFNFVCQVLPFLLVGVGVDNTFVIVSNYFDQDPDAPIEHRLGEAMALGGSSITVSCLTNVSGPKLRACPQCNLAVSSMPQCVDGVWV